MWLEHGNWNTMGWWEYLSSWLYLCWCLGHDYCNLGLQDATIREAWLFLVSFKRLYMNPQLSQNSSFIKKKVISPSHEDTRWAQRLLPDPLSRPVSHVVCPCVTQQTSQSTLGYDVTESGVQLSTAQKPIKRQGWWKVCSISDASNCGSGDVLRGSKLQRLTLLHWQSGGKGFYRQRRGLHARSWNCGSLCHGCNLGIVWVTSPHGGVSGFIRQFTGYDSEYYL